MVPLAIASDRSQAIAYSSQRLINLYPEASRFGGKSPFVLLGTPGLKPFTTAGAGPHRGGITMSEVLYVVSGPTLYRVDSDGIATDLGYISGGGLVSMATAGSQIAVATNSGDGFIYDRSTGVTQQITDADFFGGTSVTALDGYFIWSSGGNNSTRFQISALLDGLSYDALDFASAESTANELIRVFLVGTQLFMMKSDRIEIWYDSGNADFPFERLNSTIIPKGLAGKYTPALLDNTVFWLGQDDTAGGGPAVYRANGYTAEIISTDAVCSALRDVDDLSQVSGMSYVSDNHAFYGLLLPNENAWFYDVASGQWHERTTYGYNRWLGNVHTAAYGKALIGSYTDGAIYELDQNTLTDAGSLPIVADVTLPPFGTDPELKQCSRLRLDMETGVGLATGQGSDPLITLNISDDRGKTWSSDMVRSIGVVGEYGLGVEWRRMGQFRSRIHRFRISDPVKRALIALYADVA